MAALLDSVAEELASAVRVLRGNVEEPALGTCYSVRAVPTLLLFARGAVQDQLAGTATEDGSVRTWSPSRIRSEPGDVGGPKVDSRKSGLTAAKHHSSGFYPRPFSAWSESIYDNQRNPTRTRDRSCSGLCGLRR